jgi:SAM-dependent methyltransferase
MTGCRLCSSGKIKTIANLEYEGFDYTIVFCKSCDLLQCLEHHHEVSPDYVDLDSLNIDSERIWCQGHHKAFAYKKWDKNFKYLNQTRNHPLRLLDIGCGTGGFLEHAQNGEFELYGFDASKAQSEYARKRFPNVRYARSCSEYLVEHGDRKLQFDVITLWDVIEHIRNPLDYLREMRGVIRPGGLVYISTPNGLAKLWKLKLYKLFSIEIDLRGEFMPWEHVFYYSPRSLEYLLRKSGFKMLKLGAVPCYRRPLSKFEITRRALFFSMKMFPSRAFQVYAWASA